MDDHLVQVALNQGLVTAEQIAAAKVTQQSLADRGVTQSIWFLLQDLGHLREEDANRLRKQSSSTNLRALEVDGYIIQGRVGSGGMGDVFRGRNAQGHEVAIKLLGSKFANNPEYQTRFDREAKATLRLQHPHIVRSHGNGAVAGNRYLLMELVEGSSLKSRLHDHGPISEMEAMHLGMQMADALGYAWEHSVLHRDVKPANIILGPPRPGVDEPFCAKLCDFGLAKVWQEGTHDEETTHGGLTGAGLALGTPHYMSPEQASGQQDLDQRCDIYGLGASLYHALLGKTMYSGKSSAVIMYKQVTEQIDLGELRKRGVRDGMVKLIEEMLVKDRTRRVQTWRQVRERIDALHAFSKGQMAQLRPAKPLAPPTVAAPAPVPASGTPWGLLAAAAAAALVLACGGWWWLRQASSTIPSVLVASPTTLVQVLGQAQLMAQTTTGPGPEIRLAPGTYGSLRLGAAQRGVRLRGDGEVTIANPAGVALVLEPGFSGALSNLRLVGNPAVQILAGADATFDDVRLDTPDGTCALVSGGVLVGTRLIAHGVVRVQQAATVTLHEPRIEGGLVIDDAAVTLRGGSVSAADRPAVEVITGSLAVDGSALSASGAPALRLDRARPVTLRNARLVGAGSAIDANGSTIAAAEQLDLTADDVGVRWLGQFDPSWSWKAVHATAPRAAAGLPDGLVAVR